MNADDSADEASCGPTQSSMVELWDGRSYSRQALNSAHEDLAQYATDHPVLEETMPDVSRRVAFGLARYMSLVMSSICLPIATLFAVMGTATVGEALSVFVLVIVCPAVLLSCVVYVGALTNSRRDRPTTMAQAGQLTVTHGGDSVVARLDECSWFVGKLGDMRLSFHDVHERLSDSALIIELPQMPRRPFHADFRMRVPVGFTLEMRAIWIAFLTLAEVPRGKDRTGSDFVSRFFGRVFGRAPSSQ